MSINEIKKQLVQKLEKHGFNKNLVSVESRIVGLYHYVVVIVKDGDISIDEIREITDSLQGTEIDNYPGRSWNDFCKVRTFEERNRI